MAPTPAASVGVATPARIEPSTATIRTIGATSACVTRRTELPASASLRGTAGDDAGRSTAKIA